MVPSGPRMAAVDIKSGKAPGARGNELQKQMFWNGVHIKFTGDTGIFAPPLVAEKEHVDEIVDKFRASVTAFKD